MEIKVSIIIPVYNAEETISKCLESAITQTVFPKEIICIDDGSTDRSLDILSTYAEKYKYISVIAQENSGAGPARNRGLEIARGKFVCFLDADDCYVDCYALDKMTEACQKNHVKICGGFLQIFDSQTGEIQIANLHREICAGRPDGKLIYYRDYQEDFHYQCYIFERDMLKKNHIVFPHYRRYQDPPFFLKAMLQAEKFWVLPVELYCFRKNTHQTLERKMRIVDCLRGIRDNFQLAKEYHLELLQKKLLRRIGHDYLEMVLNDDNDETQNILCEIGRMLPQKYEKKVIFYYMVLLKELCKKKYGISDYLKEKNISEIILYGLGDMAKLLFWELKDSEISILYGVDRRITSFYDIKVIQDLSCINKDTLIVVTPLNETGKSIIGNLTKQKYTNTILLSDLIDKIAQKV